MKKGCLIGGVAVVLFIVIAVIIGIWAMSSYNNTIVPLDEKSKSAWGDVENQYQRRADLIPGLIETVNKATSFEKETLEAVINARAKATSIQVDPNKLTPEKIQEFQNAQSGLSSALGRLLVSVEKYPDLKSNTTILAFQSQLEGTENRISNARYNFNQAVQEYNSAIQKIPVNFIATFSGRLPKGYFKAEAGAEKAPKVKFE